MDPTSTLPTLLLVAWLLPLVSFTMIVIGYSVPQLLGMRVQYKTQRYAAYLAIGAIVTGFVLSAILLIGALMALREFGVVTGALCGSGEAAV